MQPTPHPHHARETALLVGVLTPDTAQPDLDDALDELEQLADTAGADVVERVTQALPQIHGTTFIGKGKVEEVKRLVEKHSVDVVIFDDDLSPIQLRNLEKSLGCKLVDRSGLILDIFARRAKTATAKTQVELAQLDYLKTRLTRQWTHLSRQKGGIGMRGPGETQIETDRRLISRRMAVLSEQLDRIDKQRQTQRKGRGDQTRVALVGYTNAGKSTLMNALSDAAVFAEDRLFATLDATTRQVFLDSNKSVLLSDTVGFIRKLPHKLIESFKSTLDETRESDVLLHVVDASHPNFEEHIRVVNTTLEELGARDKPTLMVFNKVDVLEERGMIPALRDEHEHAVFVSALRGIGLDALKEALLGVIESDYVERTALLPVTEPKSRAYVHRTAEVLEEETVMAQQYDEEPRPAVRLRFRTSKKNAPELDRMLARFEQLSLAVGGDGALGTAAGLADEPVGGEPGD